MDYDIALRPSPSRTVRTAQNAYAAARAVSVPQHAARIVQFNVIYSGIHARCPFSPLPYFATPPRDGLAHCSLPAYAHPCRSHFTNAAACGISTTRYLLILPSCCRLRAFTGHALLLRAPRRLNGHIL